ncbi:MAG: hypothetical protein JXQ96_09945 [Cyclobacteriaceae bacterium]
MSKTFTTYLCALIFSINFMAPTASILCSLLDISNKEYVLNLMDTETEESNEKGEGETKDSQEKEKFEDEKLRNHHAKHSQLYLNNSLRALWFETEQCYQDIVTTVPTPPPKHS